MGSVKPRFIADCNVGRLARWLRALGYDASYHATIGDAELVREAAAESRVLLTRDRYCACLWAGDSRIYLCRNGLLTQLTRDHSRGARFKSRT